MCSRCDVLSTSVRGEICLSRERRPVRRLFSVVRVNRVRASRKRRVLRTDIRTYIHFFFFLMSNRTFYTVQGWLHNNCVFYYRSARTHETAYAASVGARVRRDNKITRITYIIIVVNDEQFDAYQGGPRGAIETRPIRNCFRGLSRSYGSRASLQNPLES